MSFPVLPTPERTVSSTYAKQGPFADTEMETGAPTLGHDEGFSFPFPCLPLL